MVKHDTVLQSFAAPARSAPLMLVQRTDDEFLGGLLADLATAEGRASLPGQAPPKRGGVLEVFQPVHRVFTLALAEVFCDEPGTPRLDPRKIEGAGLVVRRVRMPHPDQPHRLVAVNEGWLRQPDGTRGWQALPDEPWDPDPKRRRRPRARNEEIDRRLRGILHTDVDDAEEHVTTLFVAPPDTCKDAGRTILYGLLPTASAETSTAPPSTFTDADLDAIVPQYLRVTPSDPAAEPVTIPSDLRGQWLSRYDADRLEGRPFMTMLALLTVSLGLFPRDAAAAGLFPRDTSVPRPEPARKLLDALDRLTIGGRPGSEFLAHAACVLVWRSPDLAPADQKILMPSTWPAVAPEIAAAIRDGMRPVLEAQAGRIVPNEGRFEVARAEYVARAFVRVKRDDGCPPVVLWSPPSELFAIRPWHAASPRPPVRVTLPDLVPGPGKLKQLQPNVTFVVPRGLADFLNGNNLKGLLKGSGTPAPPGGGLGWICGFNIPIITLCAFILLSIMLYLLNFLFWWLPFVKICIPFPSSLRARLEERP